MKNVLSGKAAHRSPAGEGAVTSWRRAMVLACTLLAMAVEGAAQSATPPDTADPVRLLVQQSQYWQSRGDGVRAKENWERLLRISPNQPEALIGLAQLALDEHRSEVARDYLRQLRAAHPGSPLIDQLEQSIRAGGNRQQMAAARTLAQQGRSSEAAAQYREAMGGQVPTGDLALEYYQALGGSAEGWDEARRGLERLLNEDPGHAGKALALAQHLTYRESTRAEGLRRLAELAERPEVVQEVRQSWRRVLPWLGSGDAAVAGYQRYLQQYPDDAQVRAQLAALHGKQQVRAGAPVPDPLRERSSAGFRALDAGRVAAAERDFQAVLAVRPGDADAQGGLGLVRLRQQRFEEARRLLQQASRGGAAGRWRSPLDSAAYWSLLRQADVERAARNWPQAQRLLEQALAIDVNEPAGQNALADVLAGSGQLAAAEQAYRAALRRRPGQIDATRGLIGVLARSGKTDEALRFYEGLTPAQQAQVGPVGALRAERDLAQARLARQNGDATVERAALESAVRSNPGDPWMRLELARLYLRLNAPEQARAIMDRLPATDGATPQALYARALLAAEQGDWPGASAFLERVPTAERTTDMGVLQKRARVHAQAAQAIVLARQGRGQESLAVLGQLRGLAETDPELLGVVAKAYAEAGQPDLAVDVLHSGIDGTGQPQPALQLAYAGILFKTGRNAELADVLQQLAAQPLSGEDLNGFQRLRASCLARQADALRRAGQLSSAHDMLASLLLEQPDNAEVVGALARVHAERGDRAQALALYTDLLQRTPHHVPTLLAAAGLAVQGRDYKYAESALASALEEAPHDPEVLAVAARVYRAQGKTRKAVEYYVAALALPPAAQGHDVDGVAATPAVKADPATVLADEYREIQQDRNVTASLGIDWRERRGEHGLGALTTRQVPFELRMPLNDGRLTLGATMVSVDGGSLATDYGVASRFGAGPVYSSKGDSAGSQNDDGVALSAGYEEQGWKADVGTTPIGFRYTSMVGGLRVEQPLNDAVSYRVGVMRRAVTDSLVSYAGARDARSGDEWGGVVATGVRGQLNLELAHDYTLYGYAAAHRLTGHDVASNSRLEGGAGVSWRLLQEKDRSLSSGLALTIFGYDKNERYFTYGHGGYFSPQSFVSLGVPIDWSQHTSRLSYRLQGTLGVQYFSEDAADYFPTSGSRQRAAYAAAQSQSGLTGAAAQARYAGQSKTGVGYNVAGSFEYQLASQLFLGGYLAMDNASDYRQYTGGLYFRHALESQSRATARQVNLYQSPYNE